MPNDQEKIVVVLTCTDGTYITLDNNNTSVREDINRYIDEYRAYKDILTIRNISDGSENLWDYKYKILNKQIHHVEVKKFVTNPESHETSEVVIQQWKNANYRFHGAYREIHHLTDGSIINEMVMILVTDIKQ